MATAPGPATSIVDQVISIVDQAISTAVTVMAALMCIVTANMVQARRFPVICPT